MKIFKNLLFLCLLTGVVCLFSSCSDDDSTSPEPTQATKLVGKWLLSAVDGVTPLTDAMFCMELRADSIELYSVGEKIDDNNKKWLKGTYNYIVSNDTITINGTDPLNKFHHVVLKIVSLTDNELKYTVVDCTIAGQQLIDNAVYTCKKSNEDYSTKIIGIWYGKCTSNNTSDTEYHYWKYNVDDSYFYYYQDNGAWVKKEDNNGTFKLYGDLFVSNYTNDLQSGAKGTTYECWFISFEGNKMKWTALRSDNKTVTYEMEKVTNLPTSK